MKWVTREHVHMDRVAAPWLIKRFVDPQAEFAFVAGGKDVPLPEGAIPFGLPGVELGAHDASGSTFRKILRKYRIDDPALDLLAGIIESGIVHVLSQIERGATDVAALKQPEGIGLDALSRGMMFLTAGDQENIDKSAMLYDALYAYCRGQVLEKTDADIAALPLARRWQAIRQRLKA